METGTFLIYDGTFEGFLTCAAQILEHDLQISGLSADPGTQNGLFTPTRNIPADRRIAEQLWESLGRKSSGLQRIIYFSFMVEKTQKERVIISYLKQLFNSEEGGDPEKLRELRNQLVAWTARVEWEKRAAESNLRFYPTASDIPCGFIAPEHDILPLLTRHFRLRFGVAPWILFDSRRQYGLRSVDGQVSIIREKPVVKEFHVFDCSQATPEKRFPETPAYRTAV
ncbi:DUF4130 domain-containing protein [Robiginitalea sp. SC105]|uniref:DUF4130 domain-containing protein n=1 Tax=Robiginitalea sp. SC105 TaxID=2762332 RepID=UPI00163A2C8D|nr:DUF4130 domain-containing protein [Robiginitalea sp. SC105]MBC2840489.1 DUF4130 domain-containing protein [Robiginitalea sp. SC105]